MSHIQVKTIKDSIVWAQGLANWYFKLLKDVDVYHQFEVNEQKLNSVYWLAAHLACSENELVLKGIFAPSHSANWLSKFDYGQVYTNDGPPWNEVKQVAREIHQMSLAAIDNLTDADLEKENGSGVGFGEKPTIRLTLIHHARHVATHCGQLGWIAKLNGIKTA